MDDARAVLGSGGVALPASGRGPGALLLGGLAGQGASADWLDEAARRLAHHGFVAWAPDLADATAEDAEQGVAEAVQRLFRADAVEGARIAAIGLGAGAPLALAAARSPRVAVALCLDPEGALEVSDAGVEARICLIAAEKDPAVAEGALEALRSALAADGARVELRVLPGVERGCLDPRRADLYDAAAARAAWDAALAVLRAEL